MTIWFLRLVTGNTAGFYSVVVYGTIYGNPKQIVHAVPGIVGTNYNGSVRDYIHQVLQTTSQYCPYINCDVEVNAMQTE